MIPRLPSGDAPGPACAAFLGALRAAGFEGDLPATDADRMMLA